MTEESIDINVLLELYWNFPPFLHYRLVFLLSNDLLLLDVSLLDRSLIHINLLPPPVFELLLNEGFPLGFEL